MIDVIQLTQDLIAIQSVSRWSNSAISDFLEGQLRQLAFEVERLEYLDVNGEQKVSLVAKKGAGIDGLALISHSDTVPGQEEDWAAFGPAVEGGKLIGRGSCDMKGPMAATIAAAAGIESAQLKKPVFIVIAADEETGGIGAQQVAADSVLFNTSRPKCGIIAEPTQLIPIYAHKGGCMIKVTAYGESAHTSTDKGTSANFLIAPFLAEMAALATQFKTDESYRNYEFDPPTPGFNMVLNDGGGPPNVTAPKTVCTLSFRTMPDDRSEEILATIKSAAEKYDFEVSSRMITPFYISPEAEIVKAACDATGLSQARTVPFGTDAFFLKDALDLVVLGPGNIAQAHTVGEWIEIAQLERAVNIYKEMISRYCIS